MKRATRTYRSEAEWQQLIQQQSSSGLSVRAFCKQRRIGDQSFYAWRNRLAKRKEPAAALNLLDITDLMTPDNVGQWHIELDLGSGIKLNLSQR